MDSNEIGRISGFRYLLCKRFVFYHVSILISGIQVPTIGQWLKTVLSPGQQVSADPKLVSVNLWLDWQNELGKWSQVLAILYDVCSSIF